jgi:hypothetical protein
VAESTRPDEPPKTPEAPALSDEVRFYRTMRRVKRFVFFSLLIGLFLVALLVRLLS